MDSPEQTDPHRPELSSIDDDFDNDDFDNDDFDNDNADDDAATERTKPWWQDHPELDAIRARVEAEIYGKVERPENDSPDPVLADYLSGDSVRELRNARDDLTRAKSRYENAVRAGRAAGLTWAQIGRVLGVSRQQLHRRFRDATDC